MEFDGSVLTHSVSNIEPGSVEEMTNSPMTLHCQHCNIVLGDSVGICGHFQYLDSVVCLSKLPYFFFFFFFTISYIKSAIFWRIVFACIT